MAQADDASLQAIHDQLGAALESRVTELMTHIKTAQALSRQIARTEEEIERQRLLREKLEADLGPQRELAARLASETEALQAELDGTTDVVERLEALKGELEQLQAGTEG